MIIIIIIITNNTNIYVDRCLSLVSVVCCQVEVSAPVQLILTECDVSNRKTSTIKRPWPIEGCCATEKIIISIINISL
jgi:hypothetical protein